MPDVRSRAMSLRHLKVIFWIAAFLIAFELALEVRASRRGWDTLLLGGGEAAPEDAGFGPTDDFPFRSRVVAMPALEDDVLCVWTASSSYGADVQLTPGTVFPNLLEDELERLGRPVVTLNASVDGHTIAHNIADLGRDGELWRPEFVVLYQMSNDINVISRGLGAYGLVSLAGGEVAGGPTGVQRLAEETTAFKNLKSQLTARLTKARVLIEELDDEAEREFEQVVLQFLEAVDELGARPVLCTFATSYVAENLDQLPREYEYNLLRFNVHLSVVGWLDAIERFNRVIERIAGERGIPLVDARAALSGRPEFFRDLWHLKPPGHQILAGLIADQIGAQVGAQIGAQPEAPR